MAVTDARVLGVVRRAGKALRSIPSTRVSFWLADQYCITDLQHYPKSRGGDWPTRNILSDFNSGIERSLTLAGRENGRKGSRQP